MAGGVQIERWFKQGFALYKESAGVLILSYLLFSLISLFTVGLLAGPLLAGLVTIGLRLHDRSEPRPQVGDLFKGFDYFKDAFLLALTLFAALLAAALLIGWIPVAGNILLYAFTGLAGLVAWFAMALVVEKKMAFWPAIRSSFDRVKPEIWPFLAFAILALLAGSIGSLLCLVGAIFTMPLYVGVMTAAYRDTFAEAGAEAGTGPAAPPPPADALPAAEGEAASDRPGQQGSPPAPGAA
jgi:hypothetical protein